MEVFWLTLLFRPCLFLSYSLKQHKVRCHIYSYERDLGAALRIKLLSSYVHPLSGANSYEDVASVTTWEMGSVLKT